MATWILQKILLLLPKVQVLMLSSFKNEISTLSIPKIFFPWLEESPWGSTQRDQKLGLSLLLTIILEIDRYCKSLGIEWFAS